MTRHAARRLPTAFLYTSDNRFRVFLVYTPEHHIAFCPIFVHPLFPVFEPHIQKWVIFVRRRPCVRDTFRSNPRVSLEKKIDFGTDSLFLLPSDNDN